MATDCDSYCTDTKRHDYSYRSAKCLISSLVISADGLHMPRVFGDTQDDDNLLSALLASAVVTTALDGMGAQPLLAHVVCCML
jgi:hypothetical protein